MKNEYVKINGIEKVLLTYVFDEKINNEIFRKNIVVDLRNLDMKDVTYVLKNYEGVQLDIADFFNWFGSDRKNDRLLYLYNDKIKDIVSEYEYFISKNLKLYKKEFIDEDRFSQIEDKNVIVNNSNNIMINNVKVNMNGFNLIWGLNGSGKTVLLRQISEFLDVPIFNYYSKDIIKLDNSEIFMNYYKKLTGKDEITKYTGIDDVYYGICNGLTYGTLNENIVLFDDLGWGLIDDYNRVKIIDILNEYSYNNGIVMTSCKNDIKRLVKKKVFNPNIIDL